MKKKMIKVFSLLLALSFVFSVSAMAIDTRASDQINNYFMDAFACGDGQIAIEFYVQGNTKMTRLGALDISIYEKSGTSWIPKQSYDEYDTGMATNSAVSYGNTIYYNGTVGKTYKVEVTIFARNSAGSDSRSQTFTGIVVR